MFELSATCVFILLLAYSAVRTRYLVLGKRGLFSELNFGIYGLKGDKVH